MVAFAHEGASVSLVNCTFEGNSIDAGTSGDTIIRTDDDASVQVNGGAEVRLEGCTFSNNTPLTVPALLADSRGADTGVLVFYSDSAFPPVCTLEGPDENSVPPPCDNSSPNTLAEAGDSFLNDSNAWLLSVQEVCLSCPAPLATVSLAGDHQ